MLKKKNIAMVMAAATVATSVAPVFAAVEKQNVDEAALIKAVEEKLAVKYTDSKVDGENGVVAPGKEYTNSVYKVQAKIDTVNLGSGVGVAIDVKSVDHLKTLIEKAEVAKKAINVVITDKGHKTVDGKIVDTFKAAKYDQNALNGLRDKVIIESANNTKVADVAVTATATDASSPVTKVEVTLVNTDVKPIELQVNSTKLDLTTGLDKDGNKIKLSEVATAEDAKKVVGFDFVQGTESIDLESKKVAELEYNVVSGKLVEFDLSTFKTETGYTEAAKELTGLLKLADGSDPNKVVTVNKDGKTYKVKYDVTNNLKIESVKDAEGKHIGYKLTIDLTVAESGKEFPTTGTNVQLVIKSKVQADLAALKAEIVAKNEVSTTKYEKLSGDSRFETSIAISKEAHKAKTRKVVLVGENAIVDGLASAPLAKKEGAPILLTKKDSIPASTMEEIKRLTEKGDKVYLVGGENTISKAVEAQLAKEMNANIVRLAGNDRYETSLKIAEELDVVNAATDFTKAYVVGGEGLADAMSVAAVAAKTGEPIIVSPAAGLTKDAKAFLDARATLVSVDVIGGTSKVNTQVLKDANEIDNVTAVERISGADRNDTNAKVIANYFGANTLDKVYVAKDGDAQLVDALAAAPLAGENSGAIVLATNDLNKAQEDAVKAAKKASNKVTQIGNGVNETVMQKVLKALGL